MITGNKREVLSVQFFLFEGRVYLGVSGEGTHFEVFDFAGLETGSHLGNSFEGSHGNNGFLFDSLL